MNCKALNNSGNPCKSEVYSSGLCKTHFNWYVRKSKRLKLINPELPIVLDKKLSRRARKKRKQTKIQCSGITNSGDRCKRLIRNNRQYCSQHKNQNPIPQPLKPKEYKKYIDSSAWASKSKSVRKDFGDRCRLCNREGLIHSHHRTYERLGIELPEDLTPLCKDCHDLFHVNYGYDKKTKTFKPIFS